MDTSTTVAINKKRDFTMVKTSTIHGKGVFAQKIIPKGTRIIEYAGKRVLKANLVKDLVKGINSLRYVMNLDEKIPVDAERDGNDSRFINHSCSPNCEVYFFNNTPYIYAMQDVDEGDEISFDYQLPDSIKRLVVKTVASHLYLSQSRSFSVRTYKGNTLIP